MKIIDLFAGCGGLSKGFEMAGFEVSGFVEYWQPAIGTHLKNFPDCSFIGKDITTIFDKEILEFISLNGKIDGIVGGPPCQGFSTIGKRDNKDPRNSLFKEFLRFVKIIEPDFFLMENVKGLLSSKLRNGKKVIDVILSEFSKLGYQTNFQLLNSAEYGVPQIRERVFIFGSKSGVINKPKITNTKQSYVSIFDALSNLPAIDVSDSGNNLQEIKLPINSPYQEYLHASNNTTLYNHIIKPPNTKDVERSKYVPEGRYIRSTRGGLKNDIFPKKSLHLSRGEMTQQKYCKLDRNLPSWTVLTDWYSMRQKTHYNQNRPFSAREVARLQSFPDDFCLTGKNITDYYRMIGNAVPPLLAFALAKEINNLYSNKEYRLSVGVQQKLL